MLSNKFSIFVFSVPKSNTMGKSLLKFPIIIKLCFSQVIIVQLCFLTNFQSLFSVCQNRTVQANRNAHFNTFILFSQAKIKFAKIAQYGQTPAQIFNNYKTLLLIGLHSAVIYFLTSCKTLFSVCQNRTMSFFVFIAYF